MVKALSTMAVGLFLSAVVPAGAQDSAERGANGTLEQALSKLNQSMEKIVELLERQMEGRKMDLVMKRLDLSAVQMGHLERELARVKSRRQPFVDEQAEIEERYKQMVRQNSDPDFLSAAAPEAETRLAYLESRIRPLDLRIIELEGELADYRREIKDWQDFLDRWFQDAF